MSKLIFIKTQIELGSHTMWSCYPAWKRLQW